jgi:hypothetical protein
MPIMPTLPSHHGWRAHQRMTSMLSRASSGLENAVLQPSESPVPRMSTLTKT